jgi:hypothetical protein
MIEPRSSHAAGLAKKQIPERASDVETVNDSERQDKGDAPYLNYPMDIRIVFPLLWSPRAAHPVRAFASVLHRSLAGGDGTW